ncbi:MAG TPA: TonB family protein [Burkholderiales bacterium]|nr:TonB family protein [Burkholderiales bacterium]
MRSDGDTIIGRNARQRLLVALAVSTALHLSLIYGIAVRPSESAPARVLLARLVPEADAPREAPTRTHVLGPRARAAAELEPAGRVPPPAEIPEPSTEAVAERAPAAGARLDDSRLPDVDMPVLADATWYDAKDLDVYPRPVVPVRPAYPATVPEITGEVALLLQIDELGVVRELSVVRAEPDGYFEQSALHAFETARFAPAQRDGRPVRSRIVVRVRFAPWMRGDDER